MSVGLDTSVVLRLLVGEPAKQAQAALVEMNALKAKGIRPLISDLVISEAYFALQYHYDVPKTKALNALKRLLNSDDVLCLGVAAEILDTASLSTAKPDFVDRVICRQYERHVGETLTFERAAKRLPHVRVIG